MEQTAPPLKKVFPPLFGLAILLAGAFAVYQFNAHLKQNRPAAGGLAAPGGKLRELFELPDFALDDNEGGELNREELRGKVWVADFFFTTCAGICTVMASRMAELQDDLVETLEPADLERVRLVSFSVDPRRDTVEKLEAYARMTQARRGFWTFVTGEEGEVQTLAQQGFKLGTDSGGGPADEIIHSSKFVLVDARGIVRGFYEGLPEKGEKLEVLVRDVVRLLGETRDEKQTIGAGNGSEG